jgi:hypothetical protein
MFKKFYLHLKNYINKKNFLRVIKIVYLKMKIFGFDARAIINFKYYPKFQKNRKQWLKQGGTINKNFMVLSDYNDNAGVTKGHYFHQDLLVASFIYENQPKRHIDVGSRIDGFVLAVASYREIEVIDIRPIPKSEHKNIKFTQADFMHPITTIDQVDSLSCLHAMEHFGLGRYNDPIDIEGHKKCINNLVELTKPGGTLYISFPIGMLDEVHFNAHRVFHPKTILEFECIYKKMKLIRFDYVDDYGNLHLNTSVDNAVDKNKYGCGIYTFKKIM